MEQIGSPETSIKNHRTPSNNPENVRSHLPLFESFAPRTKPQISRHYLCLGVRKTGTEVRRASFGSSFYVGPCRNQMLYRQSCCSLALRWSSKQSQRKRNEFISIWPLTWKRDLARYDDSASRCDEAEGTLPRQGIKCSLQVFKTLRRRFHKFITGIYFSVRT